MTIAIRLDPAFDIETYDGLVAYVTAHLELDAESAAQIPTFIRKGEYRLNRLCITPERDTTVQLTTTSGSRHVTLPVDFRQLRNARYETSTGTSLKQVTLDALHDLYAGSGKPQVYAVGDSGLQLGPIPDGAYTIDVKYTARIPALTSTNQTNWLLSGNADAYVYATLWQAAAWLKDVDAALAFRSELMAIIDEVNLQGDRYRNGTPMVPRVCGVP